MSADSIGPTSAKSSGAKRTSVSEISQGCLLSSASVYRNCCLGWKPARSLLWNQVGDRKTAVRK